jgi:hypothetical protein
MTTITLSKGGTAERTIDVQSIQVPDLWHVAMYHHDKADTIPLDNDMQAKADQKWHKMQEEMILECWNLAHDMRKHLQES